MLGTITKEMLEAIKAEADKKAKEAVEQANMLAEYFVAQATIERTSDVAITRSIAMAQAANATTAKLERLEAECTAIVAAMPVYSARTRENRKFNPTRFYGLGNDIAIVLGLLSGINYAAREHRTQLMAKTGLNSTIIEQTLESLGSLSYYSKNYGVVVEAKPYHVESLKANLDTVAAMMNISLDTSVINEDSMKALWLNAEVRALKQYNEAMDGDAIQTVEA